MQVQPALGADRSTGHQHPGLLGHDGIRMNDAEINPGYSTAIQIVLRTWHDRRDREPQQASFREQRDGADLLCWVRDGSSQSDPELRTPLGHWQTHPLSVQLEDTVVEAHRNQGAFAPWEPGILASSPTLGRLKPGAGITPHYRSGSDSGQLTEAASASEFLAQCLVADDRWPTLVLALPVGVDEPRPDVATGAE